VEQHHADILRAVESSPEERLRPSSVKFLEDRAGAGRLC
jgi:hypothetical protein